jgi:tetratricopeptide (TPR) repeat protein
MEFLSQHAKGNAEAYLHYLKGRDLIRPQYRQPREQIELARAEFEKVVELDPASPLGYVGLAIYHIRIPSFGGPPAPVSNATAETFIMKAITRDSRSVDALVILSLLRGFGQWRWHEAEQAARQAIELSPGNAYAWDIYRASVLQPMGRLREAVDAQLRARSLDPNNDNYARVIIGLYAQLRQYDDAMAEAKSLLAKEPANPGNHALMATILEYQAKYAEAIAEFRLAKLSKNSFPADSDLDLLEKALAAKGANGYHATRYALQRQRAEAAQGTWYQTAMAAASAGEHDEAFIYLDRAFKEFDRGLPWLKVEIAFDPIRKDPRFLTMLKRLNLE